MAQQQSQQVLAIASPAAADFARKDEEALAAATVWRELRVPPMFAAFCRSDGCCADPRSGGDGRPRPCQGGDEGYLYHSDHSGKSRGWEGYS